MYFPKKQNNHILNLVAQLNSCLGATYFAVGYENQKYSLVPSKFVVSMEKFNFISIEELPYIQMVLYLSGLLSGIKAANEVIKEKK